METAGLEPNEPNDLMIAVDIMDLYLKTIDGQKRQGRDTEIATGKLNDETDHPVRLVDDFNLRPRPTKQQDGSMKPPLSDKERYAIREYEIIEDVDFNDKGLGALMEAKAQEIATLYKQRAVAANAEEQNMYGMLHPRPYDVR